MGAVPVERIQLVLVTVRNRMENLFGHVTCTFQLRISPEKVIVAGNRSHPNLSIFYNNQITLIFGPKLQYTVSNRKK